MLIVGLLYREQERIAKAEAARRETDRILREQQAEVDAKKAEMVKRDIQREKVQVCRLPLHHISDVCLLEWLSDACSELVAQDARIRYGGTVMPLRFTRLQLWHQSQIMQFVF